MSGQKIYAAENPKLYDEREFYKVEIEPLIEKLKDLCTKKDIPYLMIFQTKGGPGEVLHQGKVHTGVETHSRAIARVYAILRLS